MTAHAPPSADLLAIDPGVLHPAAARFAGGRLIAAARTFVDPSWAALADGPRALLVAQALVAWDREVTGRTASHIVVEWPKVYRETKMRGADPNDLLKILGMAMAVVGLYAAHSPIAVLSPRPDEVWGQTPKAKTGDPWRSVRGARIKARLTPSEIGCVRASHDAIDAIGLGLWALGKFERVRVFPGAT